MKTFKLLALLLLIGLSLNNENVSPQLSKAVAHAIEMREL